MRKAASNFQNQYSIATSIGEFNDIKKCNPEYKSVPCHKKMHSLGEYISPQSDLRPPQMTLVRKQAYTQNHAANTILQTNSGKRSNLLLEKINPNPSKKLANTLHKE